MVDYIYSKLDTDIKFSAYRSITLNADEDDSIGAFVGGEFDLKNNMSIGAEARILAETSLSLFGSFAF